jgi:hypothetical protein
MMVWSINILVLAIGFLIVGMIKPRWLLFWMDKPGRMPIIIFSIMLFMVAAVMFGEANIEKNTFIAEKTIATTTEKKTDSAPTVAVTPVKKVEEIKE